MNDGGWISVPRSLFDPDGPLKPTGHIPASRLHAWLDLCQMATHTPRQTRYVKLERGQLIVSFRTLALRWKWSKRAVERLINGLKSGTQIVSVCGTRDGEVYQIVEYDTYARNGNIKWDSKWDAMVDRSGTEVGQEQEGKKVRTKKTPLVVDELFARARAAYPPRSGGQGWTDAETSFNGWVKKGEDPLAIIAGAERYGRYVRDTGTTFVKQASTFFGPGKHWSEEWSTNGNGSQPPKAFLPGSAARIL